MGHSVEGTSAIRDFRERFYGCLGRRADALFELTDAILTSSPVVSPVHLSLAGVTVPKWEFRTVGLTV